MSKVLKAKAYYVPVSAYDCYDYTGFQWLEAIEDIEPIDFYFHIPTFKGTLGIAHVFNYIESDLRVKANYQTALDNILDYVDDICLDNNVGVNIQSAPSYCAPDLNPNHMINTGLSNASGSLLIYLEDVNLYLRFHDVYTNNNTKIQIFDDEGYALFNSYPAGSTGYSNKFRFVIDEGTNEFKLLQRPASGYTWTYGNYTIDSNLASTLEPILEVESWADPNYGHEIIDREDGESFSYNRYTYDSTSQEYTLDDEYTFEIPYYIGSGYSNFTPDTFFDNMSGKALTLNPYSGSYPFEEDQYELVTTLANDKWELADGKNTVFSNISTISPPTLWNVLGDVDETSPTGKGIPCSPNVGAVVLNSFYTLCDPCFLELRSSGSFSVVSTYRINRVNYLYASTMYYNWLTQWINYVPQYTVSVVVSPSTQAGIITGVGTFSAGSHSVTAIARTNYSFKQWEKFVGGAYVKQTSASTYTFDLEENTTLRAVFDYNDPYNPGGHSGTGGGSGTYDNTSDTISVETSSNVNQGGQLERLYLLDETKAGILSGWLYKTDTKDQIESVWNAIGSLGKQPSDYIMGLYSYPFELTPSATTFPVNFGWYVMSDPETLTQYSWPYAAKTYTRNMGSITIEPYWDNALDYQCDIQIYLPYIGYRQLNANEVMGKTLDLIYKIDISTGDCVAQIKVGNSVLYQFNGNCATKLPIGQDTSIVGQIADIASKVANSSSAVPTMPQFTSY